MIAASVKSRRPGSIALVGIFVLTIALLLLVWVVFSGQTKYLRERMQITADAAALASAEEMVDDCWISGDANAIQDALARSRITANTYAKLNPIQNMQTPVFSNDSNAQDGDIVFGHFPLTGDDPRFQFGRQYPAQSNDPNDDLAHMDSVRIIIHRNTKHDEGQLRVVTTPTSPSGKMDGLAASIAVLDRYVYGFRPLGDQTTPFIPIALYSDTTKSSANCWENRSVANGSNDSYAFDRVTQTFGSGIDGIPEFKVRVGIRPTDDGTSVTGVLVQTFDADLTGDGKLDIADVIAQVGVGGLSAAHLTGTTFGGCIALGDNGLLTVSSTDEYPQTSSYRKSLVQNLDTLRKTGRAFVFPLYRTQGNGNNAVSVCNFVACRIVAISKKKINSNDADEDDNDDDSSDDSTQSVKRSIVITLQPAMVSVPSAMTDARRTIGGSQLPANPYIAKVRLGR